MAALTRQCILPTPWRPNVRYFRSSIESEWPRTSGSDWGKPRICPLHSSCSVNFDSLRANAGHPPTAHEWADPKVPIKGWSSPMPLSKARPGDVIAQAHGAWGHSGIVVAPGQTASVNSTTHPAGIVTVNSWGFRPRGQNGEGRNDPAPVVRRYIGDDQ